LIVTDLFTNLCESVLPWRQTFTSIKTKFKISSKILCRWNGDPVSPTFCWWHQGGSPHKKSVERTQKTSIV